MSETVHSMRVYLENGKRWVTSIDTAKHYKCRHADVLRKIRKLRTENKSFFEVNFELDQYKDLTGRLSPMYKMTLEGLMLFVISFSSKKTEAEKIRLINWYNQLEKLCMDTEESIDVMEITPGIFLIT